MIELLVDATVEVDGIWRSSLADPITASCYGSRGIGLNALMNHIDDAGIVDCVGPTIDKTSSRGETSLHFASPLAVVKLILSWRPDLRIENLNGQSASDKTRQAGRNEITHLIEEHY